MIYSDGFKARMIQRMAGPESISANALAQEVGIGQPTLSRWLRDARTFESMGNKKSKNGSKKRVGKKARTSSEKLRLLLEASGLSESELGEFLRREGLHSSTLKEWTDAATAGLSPTKKPASSKKSPEARKIAELERDLQRKEKALAEMAALITLQKKVQAIWGDGASDTDTKRGT